MSGCHVPKIPAMVSIERKEDSTLYICLGCKEVLPCQCIWAAIRDLQEKVPLHWDLNYKAQEGLSKRLTKIEHSYVSLQLIVTMRETIETWQKGCEVLMADLQNRIAMIEDKNADFTQWIMDKQEKLRLIEESIDSLETFKSAELRKPHRCPVCEGNGFNYHAMVRQVECKACAGKGIVWG